MDFSKLEYEVIALRAIGGSLDSLINRKMLHLAGTDGQTYVTFDSSVHQQLFNVLLVDFLERVDSNVTGKCGSCLDVLRSICQVPMFDDQGSVEYLSTPVAALERWLDTEVIVESWFPSIDTNAELQIRRSEFLYICGNISKHNFARLTKTSKKLAEILVRNGIEVDPIDAMHILEEFYERFHSDILAYHVSTIAQLFNDVRWGIHEYLWSEFFRSYTQDPGDPIKYSYRYPGGLQHEFAKTCYWELMNDVRRKPFVDRFRAAELLRTRY